MSATKYTDNLPAEIVEAMLEALTPIAPARSGEIKKCLLDRVRDESSRAAAAEFTTIRKGEGVWAALLPGLAAKELHDDGKTRTWLARIESGAKIPGHLHIGDEECLVVEGVIYFGEQRMEQGDYQLARSGSTHAEGYSPTGCLLLLRSPSEKAALA